ncbi:homogentisate 1,2-dioxygenase [Pseudogracilibacillus auburnensis]|uniref:Homogentisate 1,2-dioxygenase n=1 Tax=Pseudogracilibacillus auburnensis TaxID=1494959 RepID=A0A2V3VTT9_9BACI|nr:homogentisate 1,2-dioxygenase [Pseudogracilibacillus auburnensis]PXW83425.1 homogentisate 1,2-dioxygenase [Pseudogracilibacillus auburnensis]
MFYKQLGKIPKKRHTIFRKEDGSLYKEQVMGTKGFSGIQSILYHHNAPTQIEEANLLGKFNLEYEDQQALAYRHFLTDKTNEKNEDAVEGREYMLGNDDLVIGVVYPKKGMEYFYRNADGDEVLFVHYGTGKVETMFGTLKYRPGDYIVLPIGTIYRVIPNGEDTKFLVVETSGWITTPKRYRNEFGQLLEHSPFCERDIHGPEKLETHNEVGEFEVRTKTRGYIHQHIFNYHPLDVVGWDGYLFPYTFNIEDFEPITGRIHQPPPVHQTFEGNNFVICSFVPRLYDYHPEAIPAPYYHSNVDSDEVLYYVEGNFMSRKGINEGSITLHPSGIPHGPHPGTIEASIGKKETLELAVMIDTFKPLKVLKEVHSTEDTSYKYSWRSNE